MKENPLAVRFAVRFELDLNTGKARADITNDTWIELTPCVCPLDHRKVEFKAELKSANSLSMGEAEITKTHRIPLVALTALRETADAEVEKLENSRIACALLALTLFDGERHEEEPEVVPSPVSAPSVPVTETPSQLNAPDEFDGDHFFRGVSADEFNMEDLKEVVSASKIVAPLGFLQHYFSGSGAQLAADSDPTDFDAMAAEVLSNPVAAKAAADNKAIRELADWTEGEDDLWTRSDGLGVRPLRLGYPEGSWAGFYQDPDGIWNPIPWNHLTGTEDGATNPQRNRAEAIEWVDSIFPVASYDKERWVELEPTLWRRLDGAQVRYMMMVSGSRWLVALASSNNFLKDERDHIRVWLYRQQAMSFVDQNYTLSTE